METTVVLRPLRGLVVGGVGATVAIGALLPFRDNLTPATPALVLVVPVLLAALAGGRWPAVATSFVGAAAFSLAFIPPFGSLRVNLPEDTVALLVFLVVAVVSGTLVAREADRRRVAEQRADEINRLYVEHRRLVAEREAFAEEAARVQVLEEIDRQRSMLLRSVSHDLRTPLASIRAVSTDLRDGFAYDEQLRNELLDLMSDEAARLDRIVANLLSLSRIEAGALLPERTSVDLGELIESCADRLARLFTDHVLFLELTPGAPFVMADHVQIDQVVTNLLENATRHTPPGTCVRVHVAASEDGRHVAVAVSDDGPGVSPVLRPSVFAAFRSATTATTGVGLAICKAIVEAHGGTISLRDSPDGGAEFCFTLPAAG
jgi:two-component system sensor histidine kinase KdpD